MARATDVRPMTELTSSTRTGYADGTRTNRRNDPDRLVLREYDPTTRHVESEEDR